jgi:NAD(P)-dependent dehydrogenase (short-subunit alcohol dehydrogenase family)
MERQIALVTGAGRGIGAASARALGRAGFGIFAVARTAPELDAVCEAIRLEGTAAVAYSADVGRAGAGADIARACEQQLGPPAVLVNAAGIQRAIGLVGDVHLDEWWSVLEVNLRGTVELCAAVVPGMVERGRGIIINFSGGGATSPRPRFSAYAASKAALVRFTETLAEEVRGSGVRVNAIAPGAVDTRIQDAVLAAGAAAGPEYEQTLELRRAGTGGVPAELAASLVVHLAVGGAGDLTGKLISAPYDDWRAWDAGRIQVLTDSAWLTLRRLDEYTLRGLGPVPRPSDQ